MTLEQYGGYAALAEKYRVVSAQPVAKGWSEDEKFCLHTAGGERLFLRVSNAREGERKRAEYELARRMDAAGVPIARPLGFGPMGDGAVYTLTAWLEGEDVQTALARVDEQGRLLLGMRAGEALQRLHTLGAPASLPPWSERFFAVTDGRVAAYRERGAAFAGSERVLRYLAENRALLQARPQCLIHGDFHEGNLMLGADGRVFLVDFLDEGFGGYGDPWYEFRALDGGCGAAFFTGVVRGYFGGEPPRAFLDVLGYYLTLAALTSIVWMQMNRPDGVPGALKQNEANARLLAQGKPAVSWYRPSLPWPKEARP